MFLAAARANALEPAKRIINIAFRCWGSEPTVLTEAWGPDLPAQGGGPDAFVTVAPVFSHTWERKVGGRVTPYGGATATFKIGGRGTDVNVLLGVKVSEIAKRWDFVAEVQPGEKTLFAVGFVFRFTD